MTRETDDERSLRVLHVLRAPVGGLFRHVRDLAREQAARGHSIGMFVDLTTGGPAGVYTSASLLKSVARICPFGSTRKL